MTCACETICRLPTRCARLAPAHSTRETYEAWKFVVEDALTRIEWVMPEAAQELRDLLANPPERPLL